MKKRSMLSALCLTVAAIFALCLLLTVLTGAKVYRQTVEDTEKAFAARTKTQYLSTKLRQGQEISLEPFGGATALAIREELDGECYVTYVYCHEGWLKELFCAEGALLAPADGERVLEAEALEAAMEDGLLTVRLDGECLYFALR